MKWGYALLLFCFFTINVQAQYITGIATNWSDSFSEWTIYTDDEDLEGELRMRWQNDWTEWEYRIGEAIGRIKLKWKNNPNEWEIRGDNEIITARTLWNNNFREWRITDNSTQITLRCRFGNTFDEWEIKGSKGTLDVFTAWEGDPREWNIDDYMDEDVGLPMKMAIIFIATFHSSPKE